MFCQHCHLCLCASLRSNLRKYIQIVQEIFMLMGLNVQLSVFIMKRKAFLIHFLENAHISIIVCSMEKYCLWKNILLKL